MTQDKKAVEQDTTARNIDRMREAWGPLERGESDDLQPFFDLLVDDLVFELPVGALYGKQALSDYFAHASETMEFDPFAEPLEYFGDGDRVVLLGNEIFTDRDSGLTHRARWAWKVTFRDGKVTRITHIQDISGVVELVKEAFLEAQTNPLRPAGTG